MSLETKQPERKKNRYDRAEKDDNNQYSPNEENQGQVAAIVVSVEVSECVNLENDKNGNAKPDEGARGKPTDPVLQLKRWSRLDFYHWLYRTRRGACVA